MALPPLPPALKKITQYVKRAEELDKDVTHPESKIVAYYCRQYAMEQGIAMRDSANSKEIMPYLIAMMDHLEKEKKTLAGHSAEEGKATVQQFADRVFNKGDEEDQLGVADKGTARTFYAAGVFYDVMQQFKDLDTAVEAKRKYCKWKAADILNAIKEGRTPAPGGFAATTNAGDSGASLGDGTAAGGGIAGEDMMASESKIPPPAPTDIPQAPVSSPFSLPTSPPRPQQPAEDPFAPPPYSSVIPGGGGAHTDGARADGPSQPSITSPKVPPPSYTSTGTSSGARLPPSATVTDAGRSSSAGKGLGQGPSRVPSNSVSAAKAAAIKDATELCYFAIAAMQHKEVDLAVERLERALATLKKS